MVVNQRVCLILIEPQLRCQAPRDPSLKMAQLDVMRLAMKPTDWQSLSALAEDRPRNRIELVFLKSRSIQHSRRNKRRHAQHLEIAREIKDFKRRNPNARDVNSGSGEGGGDLRVALVNRRD